MKGKDKMIAARVRLLYENVFFGAIATELELIEVSSIPTAGTDGKRLIFNSEFINGLSKGEMKFLVAHEVLHLVLMTHLRRGHRDPKVWNMATDFAINQLLKDEGFQLIADCLINDKYREWSSEKIYDHLMKNPEEQPGVGAEGWNVGEVMDGGSLGEDGKPTNGPPLTTEEKAVAEANMKSQIQGAVMAAKRAGTMSAGLDRLVDAICAPKANWRDILQRFINEKAFSDWEFGTCHTRMLHQYGIISPILGGDALGNLAIIVDTSGSVDEEQLSQFAGEISDILENYDCNITVIYIDTQINRIDEYSQDDLPLRLHAVGSGGTVQKEAYDYVEEHLRESAALIAYTDSYYFDWKEIKEPSCPALMACTSKSIDADVPEWMEIIDIS